VFLEVVSHVWEKCEKRKESACLRLLGVRHCNWHS